MNVLVAGIGGSGVVTLGALLGMAAHLEGKGCSVLDVTGLAQKNGPVTSHVRIANDPGALFATRIGAGAADLVLGCDIVVTAGAEVLSKLAKGRSLVIVNEHVAPTADFATHPDLDLSAGAMQDAIRRSAGDDGCRLLPATELATALLGDAIAANLFLLGYALQLGRLPVGLGALERAIELNGRAVQANLKALAWGRLAAHDLEAALRGRAPRAAPGRDGARHHAGGDRGPARGVPDRVPERRPTRAATASWWSASPPASASARPGGPASPRRWRVTTSSCSPTRTSTRSRGSGRTAPSAGSWSASSRAGTASSCISRPRSRIPRDPDTGRARKWILGPWVFRGLGLLAKLKFLRGTPLDPFGWTEHRRRERELIREYERTLEGLLAGLSPETHPIAVEIASLPEQIRGFDLVKDEHLAAARTRQAELLKSSAPVDRGARPASELCVWATSSAPRGGA